MLIDTHAHLNFNAYKNDIDGVVERMEKAGVFAIVPSSQINTSRRAIEIAKKYDNVWAAVGLHPIHLKQIQADDKEFGANFKTRAEEFDYEAYKKLASEPKVIAIGENGLDKAEWLNLTRGEYDLQKQVFNKHLDLAEDLNKPIIVHCRKAYDDILEILKMRFKEKGSLPGGVAHCFIGRWSQAERYLNLGFYISFTGIITYDRSYDKIIKNAPLEKILVETDAPYLTPQPLRGRRNEPINVKYVAKKIAEVRGIKFEEVVHITTENAKRLFKLNI